MLTHLNDSIESTTPILEPKETSDLERILNLKYASVRGDKEFNITTFSHPDGPWVKILLSSRDKKFYYPVEARIIQKLESDDVKRETTLTLIDYIDYYFDQFFETNEYTTLPIDWAKYSFEGLDFAMRGQILNLYCENLANNLIAEPNNN